MADKQALNLSNQFLIAMPGMDDPNFSRTLIYICHHDAEGAMGIVINRETSAGLDQLLAQVNIESEIRLDTKVLYGGPVKPEQGFILHSNDGEPLSNAASQTIDEQVGLSGSLEMLRSIAAGKGPRQYLVSLGYSGWGADQLETEIVRNSWLTAEADTDIIFNCPIDKRWERAVASLGFDPATLIDTAGHA
ncbi:MAG: YqgE/AlgH family protein [Cellvibrionaceae bacterium]|nr:YqgE/AlgH family protein [Cellvibrionaceae bacterium]MCV6624630.1 YqgE/AlgH family protein [Cellvibrionaceae bacterium]